MNQQNQITSLTSSDEPSTTEAIDRALTSRDRRGVPAAITQMLLVFPRKADEEDAAILVAGFVAILEDIPAEAVKRAALKVCRGQAPGMDRRFAPSAAEFYAYAASIATGWADQRLKLLEAPNRPGLRTRQEITAEDQAKWAALDAETKAKGWTSEPPGPLKGFRKAAATDNTNDAA